MNHNEKQNRKINPRERANLLSILTFGYTGGLFRKAIKNDLEEDDIYEVIEICESKRCGDKLEKQWEVEKQRNKSPSIVHLLWACFGLRYVALGMINLAWKLLSSNMEPEAMGKLVSYFKPGQTRLTKDDAMYYAGIIIGLKVLHWIYYQNYQIYLQQLAIQMRTAFCSLIYRKSLKLSPTADSDVNLGNIITLITKDVITFEHSIWLFNDFWISVLETLMICYMIYAKMGVASIIAVGSLLTIVPMQMFMGKCITSMRLKINKKTDCRLQVTQEALSAIKIIKMYTWELFFEEKVGETRKSEMKTHMQCFYLKMVIIITGVFCSKIGFYLLVMVYIWMGNDISAEMVFYVMTCFNRLKHTIGILIPLGLTRAAELYASLTRIKKVLLADELETQPEETYQITTPKINLKNLSVQIKNKSILSDVSLTLHPGLTVVTGSLGSGKSSLLKAILLDYPASQGGVTTDGRKSYASQDPWLFPSSIKQNILFGQAFDAKRYREVIKVCALEYDFELFEKGDETIVADKGLNLSKGQQARINLARAVYKESEIYLLDDSLTALDPQVQEVIFNQCIKGFLKNSLVVLVSHNPKHIQEADHVVVLAKGFVKFSGKHGEVSPTQVLKYLDEDIEELLEDPAEKDKDLSGLASEKTKLLEAMPSVKKRKVYQETKQKGSVNVEVYARYLKFGGGFLIFTLIVFMFGISQFTESSSSKLLSTWVNMQQKVSDIKLQNQSNSTIYEEAVEKTDFTIMMYSIMIITSSCLELIKIYFILNFARKASINLHQSMVSTIINSVMSFFDSYFIGNILNRFSQDLNIIDEHLPFSLMQVVNTSFGIGGIIVLIATVHWTFLIPSLIFLSILGLLRFVYMPTARSMKRLEAATRSPLVGHLNASMEGVTTIRAYRAENILKDEFDRHQDLYTSANYISYCAKRAFGFYVDSFSVIFISLIIARFLFIDIGSSAGDVGLALTQASILAMYVQFGIMQWSEIENLMTSVERVLEYTHLKTESSVGQTVENWPNSGTVTYSGVTLTYANTNELVLKNINFSVGSKEKIGIVGRTGAGKSSIIATLFRLYNFEGKILIDNVDTKTLSLDFLRKSISIIPQDPILFAGTIRTNIDPLSRYSDKEIWLAIEKAKIKDIISSLDLLISDNDANFSTGQRQLICLARAIVRKNKIVILDEATANMDPETDALIQDAIKENFSDCTVFTIAHRLHSILDCHKILVMEKGEIIEYDDPRKLMMDKNSVFYRMTKQSGLGESIE